MSTSVFANTPFTEVVATNKLSVVGIGVYDPLARPRAQIKGTGFVILDGTIIVTNKHVLTDLTESQSNSKQVVFHGVGKSPDVLDATVLKTDQKYDLAILKINKKLPTMQLADGEWQVDATEIAFTGFPIGAVLGLYPVTHRGIISARTPIVNPSPSSQQLTIEAVKRLREPFFTYQLDATAYPGNSGSAVYLKENGKVIAILNSVHVKETKEEVLNKPSGISYAIPVKYLLKILKELKLTD